MDILLIPMDWKTIPVLSMPVSSSFSFCSNPTPAIKVERDFKHALLLIFRSVGLETSTSN
jgi:hypothetical protein